MESYFQKFVIAGGIMMVFLIPTSITAIALIVHGFIDLRRGKVMPREVDAAFETATSPADLRAKLDAAPDSPLQRVCARLLPWVGSHDESWDMAVQQVSSEETAALYQRHGYLSIVYGVAPLMGLLGTILGMVRAFSVFGASANQEIRDLGRGISEALITTMWGLFIAVPALLFLSLFRQKIYRYENDLIPARVRKLFAAYEEALRQAQAAAVAQRRVAPQPQKALPVAEETAEE